MQVYTVMSSGEIEERVDIEEWVRMRSLPYGDDTYLRIAPEHGRNVTLRIVESELLLDYVDADGQPGTVLLHRYTKE